MKTVYEKMVETYRKKESEDVLTNIDRAHARVLFENLLKIAEEKKEEVCIYSGTLHKDFYNQLTDSVESALQKTKVLVAVAKNEDMENNSFAQAVKDSPNGEFKKDVDVLGEKYPHFILVGDKRYRFEKDDITKEAIACFNDSLLGEMLVGAKQRLFPRENKANN